MSSSLFSRQHEPHAADTGLDFEPRQGLPTVIVKRSRLAGRVHPAEKDAPAARAAGPVRDPKVFRVAPAPEARAEATASAPAPESTPQAAAPRRKRDPMRAPRLLRHEVLAPQAPPEPPAAATAAPADYRAVCEALEDLRRHLALVRQARQFKLALI